MLERSIRHVVRKRLAAYPAVGLIGPRQCGKTTLAKAFGGAYFDLEQDVDRLRLDLEWQSLVSARKLIVLDEAHAWPEIFPRIRGAIDEQRKRNGRFLMLGSVSPELMTRVSESLAGRLSLVELTPLLMGEVAMDAQRQRLWLCGGFPDGGVLSPRRFPGWQQDYVRLLTRRDLPIWGLPAKPQVTERLLAMLGALHGQLWNASKVGRSMGLDFKTVNTYLDYLEGAFLIRRLQPFTPNVAKRLVKSPKVFFRDSGLLHALMGVSSREELLTQPWVGASWEGFVIEQVLGALSSSGREFRAYHFRTSDQHELDLVVEIGNEVWAFEIKLTTSPSPAQMEHLDRVTDLTDAKRRVLVTQVANPAGSDNRLSCNLVHLLQVIKGW